MKKFVYVILLYALSAYAAQDYYDLVFTVNDLQFYQQMTPYTQENGEQAYCPWTKFVIIKKDNEMILQDFRIGLMPLVKKIMFEDDEEKFIVTYSCLLDRSKKVLSKKFEYNNELKKHFNKSQAPIPKLTKAT